MVAGAAFALLQNPLWEPELQEIGLSLAAKTAGVECCYGPILTNQQEGW